MTLRRLAIIALLLTLLAATMIPPAEPVEAQQGPIRYTVRRGDTWTAVSTRYRVNMCTLALANGHRRCSSIYRASSALLVGQTLDIQPGASDGR